MIDAHQIRSRSRGGRKVVLKVVLRIKFDEEKKEKKKREEMYVWIFYVYNIIDKG